MKAYLAGGCFWCVTPIYKLYGVDKVLCGYSGGDEASPTYEDVKAQRTGHRETIMLEYDPGKITYDKILDIFFGLDKKFKYIRTHLKLNSTGYDKKLEEYRLDVIRIQGALRRMNVNESYIITQTFHYDGTYSNLWWQGIFTKSSFYRLRAKAIKSFLKEYHAI